MPIMITLILKTGKKEKWMNRSCRVEGQRWLSRVSLLFTGEGVKTTTENNRRNAQTTCFAVNQSTNGAGFVLAFIIIHEIEHMARNSTHF